MKSIPKPHPKEIHKSHRAPWLRAAMLGANDGIVSTASLMLGVLAAFDGNPNAVLVAGIAGLAAGGLSMAAGEYVSVSSQRDSELSDLEIEKKSLKNNPSGELNELAWFYQERGLSTSLAKEVAKQLQEHDAIDAHAKAELGINDEDLANPVEAAIASAVAFAIGASLPILAAVLTGSSNGVWAIPVVSLAALFMSGAGAAYIGGGNKIKAALRVFIGGGAAMAITYIIGHLIGTSV